MRQKTTIRKACGVMRVRRGVIQQDVRHAGKAGRRKEAMRETAYSASQDNMPCAIHMARHAEGVMKA